MLKLKNIGVTVGDTELKRTVLNHLDLQVQRGEFIVIIGNNGAGKSTLFNVISGFIKPVLGKVFILGQDVTDTSPLKRSELISKVMQDPKVGTLEHMTILENMAFAFQRGKKRGFQFFSNRMRIQLFKEKLSLLNMDLENKLNERVSHLSGGQRQALSLIMAILQDSKILLLDEITAALDPASSETIMALTHKLICEQKRTCIMITHNMAHAIQYGDRLLLLKNGNFVKEYDATAKSPLTEAELAMQFALI